MGVTLACFQISGKQPVYMDLLYKSEIRRAITSAVSLSILLLMLSGPLDMLVFNCFKTSYTLRGVNIISNNLAYVLKCKGGNAKLPGGFFMLELLAKKSFKTVALESDVPYILFSSIMVGISHCDFP